MTGGQVAALIFALLLLLPGARNHREFIRRVEI
jgi:hypothetical protein